MTRILWNLCPSYWGLSQLITILKDLPLAAVKANSRTLNSVERANSPWRSRDPLFRFVKAKSTSRAIVLARPGRLQDFLEADEKQFGVLAWRPQHKHCAALDGATSYVQDDRPGSRIDRIVRWNVIG